MDRGAVLEYLGLALEDWGPMWSTGTYAEFAATWRGSVPVPTQQEMQDAWAVVEQLLQAEALADAEEQAAQDEFPRDWRKQITLSHLAQIDAIQTLATGGSLSAQQINRLQTAKARWQAARDRIDGVSTP